MKGVINLNKPRGISSSKAVSKVKKILNTKRVGHMGTLDPLAEGVLIIGVGKATKLFDYFLNKDKVYEAEFTFGYETDTLDSEGKIINTSLILPEIEDILRVKDKLIGKYGQIPPLYSAKNIDGQRAYNLARQGKHIELKESVIEVFDIRLIGGESPAFKLLIHCSSGTYIRSIARDLAYLLNTYGTMTALKRIKSGNYDLKNSITFENLESLKEKALERIEDSTKDLPKIILETQYKRHLDNGIKIKKDDLPDIFCLYCDNILYGIAKNDNGYIKISTYLKD